MTARLGRILDRAAASLSAAEAPDVAMARTAAGGALAGRLVLAVAALLCFVSASASGVIIEVGSATGAPGEEVTFEVRLNTTGQQVVATKNFISVESSMALISCQENPNILKDNSTFAFKPDGCRNPDSTQDCNEVQALVLSLVNVFPIPNGRVLYSCKVRINEDASVGTFPLLCPGPESAQRPESSDPDGTDLETDCTSGSIEVVMATATPTPTATPRATPTGSTTGVLAAEVGPEDTVIVLENASAFPISGTIVVDGEIISYAAKSGDELADATRGAFGTIPASHAGGALVVLIPGVGDDDGGNGGGGGGGGGGCRIGGERTVGAISPLLALSLVAMCLRGYRRRA